MKQQKLNNYKPTYPKKTLKGMTLAAAALLALGTSVACSVPNAEPELSGAVAVDEPGVEETVPPEEVQTEGMIPIEEMPTPEPLLTTGEPTLPPTEEPEEIMLMGDVAILDEP